jgi:pimeloyl-ACP methyl ester carboxylesterase
VKHEPQLVSGAAQAGRAYSGATTEALYLQTDFEPVFAMVHLPAPARRLLTGVVICPTFGWDDLCTYRARRAWARRLCRAGHPVIRFDLPGTGDSPGDVHDPDRLDAWTAAAAAAADWLRADAGCRRVAGIGIGLGGMIAWRAAAQGAAIDDLALWAVPLKGRRLLREARAAALLTIDPKIEDADVLAAAPDVGEDLLDEAGQITSKQTLDELARVDLGKLPLPDPERRRVLAFVRSGHEADAGVREVFETQGIEVTAADGDGYEPMMQYVQQSRIPVEAIERSIAWLADSEKRAAAGAQLAVAAPSGRSLQTLEIQHDGVAIRERPLTIELGGQTLRGIVTEPVGAAPAGLCAVFFSGGSDRRIGPNRMWVEASRRWAAAGLCAVRVDPAGVGDSEGDEQFWDPLPAHYVPDHVDRAVELLDELQERGLPSRFVLSGFCSGAYKSLHVAMVDPRVAGVFAIGLPFFYWSPWVRLRDWWVRDWEPSGLDRWQKKVALRILQRVLPLVSSARRHAIRLFARQPRRAEVALRSLSDRSTELMLLFKSGSHEWEELDSDGQLDRLRALPGVEMGVVPGRDMRFRPLALQAYVNGALDAALGRLIAAGQPASVAPAPARPATSGWRRLRLPSAGRRGNRKSIDSVPRGQYSVRD